MSYLPVFALIATQIFSPALLNQIFLNPLWGSVSVAAPLLLAVGKSFVAVANKDEETPAVAEFFSTLRMNTNWLGLAAVAAIIWAGAASTGSVAPFAFAAPSALNIG